MICNDFWGNGFRSLSCPKFNDVSKITSNAKLYYTVLMVIEEMIQDELWMEWHDVHPRMMSKQHLSLLLSIVVVINLGKIEIYQQVLKVAY